MEKDEKDRLKEEAGISAYIGSEADSDETVSAVTAGNGYDKAESDKAVSSDPGSMKFAAIYHHSLSTGLLLKRIRE